MEFIKEEDKKFVFNSTSKSRIGLYQKCPALAYKKIRDTKRSLEENEAIQKGFLYHELAARELFKMSPNKDYEYDDTRIKEFSNLKIYNEAMNDFNYLNLGRILEGQAIIDIEKEISIDMPKVAENFTLRIKPDGLSYLSIDKKDFIGIIEFKSGYSNISVVDSEAILYAYGVAIKYNLPVYFQRINLSNGKKFVRKFSVYELKAMENQIVYVLKKWKSDMEGNVIPEIKPGNHCLYCPELKKCSGRKNVNTLRQKYKASIVLKKLAKVYEDEIKEAAKEVLENSPEYTEESGEQILLPFLDNKFGAISKTSDYNSLASRKLKKEEVKDLIIDYVLSNPTAETVQMLKDAMSLSLTDEVVGILENGSLRDVILSSENEGLKSVFKKEDFSIPIKRIFKTAISIKESYIEEDGDGDEDE